MLDVMDLEETQEIINREIIENISRSEESVLIKNAHKRILSQDIQSPINVPDFDKSIYDGYALRAKDTFRANESNPVKLKNIGEINAGDRPGRIEKGECKEILTGAPLPKNADAVIKLENIYYENNEVRISKSLYPNQNVVQKGEDIQKNQRILEKGVNLNYRETGLLSSLGISEVSVYEKPRIAVISTGDEIILPENEKEKGKIYDVNGRTLTDALREMGTNSFFLGIARDNINDLKKKIKSTMDYEMTIISGGASVGGKDHTIRILEEMGRNLIHGVAVKPGKPLIVSKINEKPVFGLPGNPTSSLIQFHVVIKPVIEEMIGKSFSEQKKEGIIQERVKCPKGRKFLLPVYMKEKKVLPSFKGSFAITSFTNAQGWVEIPKNVDYLEKGKEVKVNLFNP